MHGETQAHGMVSHSHSHILYTHAQAQAVQKFETGTHSHFEPAPKCTVAQQRGYTHKQTHNATLVFKQAHPQNVLAMGSRCSKGSKDTPEGSGKESKDL